MSAMHSELETAGLAGLGKIHENLSVETLCKEIDKRCEGNRSSAGAIVVETGDYTGRSPNDKFIVREGSTETDIDWGSANRPFDEAHFDAIFDRVSAYLHGRDVFIQDLYAGADPHFRLPVRVVTEMAWHSLFARNMFICEEDPARLATFQPAWHLIYAPGFAADPQRDHTRSEVFVILNFARKLILIGGTRYAGELKKSVFTLLNYILPKQSVLSMHCSANKTADGKTTLFFGLSGTGKTTLSASADYELIGDDELGWSDKGVFNFEGGCYAKVIRLSAEAEPEIYAAAHNAGTLLENVVLDTSGEVDFDDASLTENTRASYELRAIPNASADGLGGHPANIIMLTCDAFGVMPPVAKLTPEQAMYHFVSGYTAKIAGTERGVSEPSATFSPCYGAAFMVLPPLAYAHMLGDRIRTHNSRCWLVNTGWSGGPYGEGERISIAHTRAIVSAIIEGDLDGVSYERDPAFGLDLPTSCPHVPPDILTPRATWKSSDAYDKKARYLLGLFADHFEPFAQAAPELGPIAQAQ